MKYVTLQEKGRGLRTAVLAFSPIAHRELAENFRHTHTVVGAGFVELDPLGGTPTCYGHSESLGRGPAPGDAELIGALQRANRRSSANACLMPEPPAVHASPFLNIDEVRPTEEATG